MAEQKPTREGIIKAWEEADAKSDRPVGQKEVAKALKISPYWISQLFAGESLTKMKREQGVIFLFGMISKDLGFDSIKYLGDDFPDCETKWRVGIQHQLQRVNIEFELKSSHFNEHGHDAQKCDVIVCWEHDWKECPSSLKVIELKKEIKGL